MSVNKAFRFVPNPFKIKSTSSDWHELTARFLQLMSECPEIRDYPAGLTDSKLVREIGKIRSRLGQNLPIQAPSGLAAAARALFTHRDWQELREMLMAASPGLMTIPERQVETLSLGLCWMILVLEEWDARRLSGSLNADLTEEVAPWVAAQT